ncbi:DUF6775 family putative metallopeptidase [Candidatus Nitrosotenuis sp. DW1]|uniref:DUF6775 family putative metallopeptidase n=1 Tax=Candidatus Nitrosotenuis sp. DW1 TaxID=2259672 RepID=UPI0015CC2E5C|nr:DUF6775 family putative metallopeptidase [Candidatus Nitrosotenuis sp. DW1]QLH08722.1 hypothetical protein DSQ19_03790 [Candidatus Nitrosotenuis sp. DW1]
MRISRIFLYDEPSVPEISISNLVDFLQNTFHVKTTRRENIFKSATEATAHDLAASRIFNMHQPFQSHTPANEEVEFEKQTLQDTSKVENIVLYDGFEFQRIVSSLIPSDELTTGDFHFVFTNKLTCTFDSSDYRYHGRALIGANPSIISTTGIIEAPAKPRQYYMDLMANYGQGLNIESIKKKYQGTYLEYHDSRLGKIVEGYCLQALFYYITGESFCDLLDCRLNNAHWQRDLLYSQIEFGKLCSKHSDILKNWIMP